MELAELAGVELGNRTVEYDDRTSILYALCAGASGDELDLIWEEQLRVMPSLSTALGLWAVEAAGDLGAYDRTKSLHVGQTLKVLDRMPPTGRIDTSAKINSVWDKGRAAIVEIGVTSEFFELGYTIFLPGMGGFGGDSGPASVKSPELEPTATSNVPTDERLALFYRLTGDRHPVHVNPETAASNGFERPILHGLCTLAIAAHSVARLNDVHPADLKELNAKFAAPVLPGEELTVRVAPGPDSSTRFDVMVEDRVVLKDGSARF